MMKELSCMVWFWKISVPLRNQTLNCQPGGPSRADFTLWIRMRKVRATKSTILPNGKPRATAESEKNRPIIDGGAVTAAPTPLWARVKRWGKSPPDIIVRWCAARLMGCKVKYTGIQGLLAHCRGVDCFSHMATCGIDK